MEIYERFDCCHAAVNTAMLYVTTVNCSCSRKSQSNHYIVQLLFNSDSIKPLDSFVFRMSCMETFFFFYILKQDSTCFSCLGESSNIGKLQKSFADYESSTDCLSAWGWTVPLLFSATGIHWGGFLPPVCVFSIIY